MYLSYSGYKLACQCLMAYWSRYVGKPEGVEADNRVNSLYGTVVGLLFEAFYTEKLWRVPNPTAEMSKRAEAVYEKAVAHELSKGGLLNWEDEKANYASKEELLSDIREAVERGVRTIRRHRLVGPWMQAEVKLNTDFQGHTLGGRADFIIKRVPPDNDLILLDGKGSRWREKYVDREQLLWYAMLCRLKGKIPDRLGFLYWRCEPEEALGWIPFRPEDLDGFQTKVMAKIAELENCAKDRKYPPAMGNWCTFCQYPRTNCNGAT